MSHIALYRDPFGWVNPHYRRPRHAHPHAALLDIDNFLQPALETVDTLSQLINLANKDPNVILSRQQKPSDKFEVKMDVQQFSPNELDVKMVDNCVVIEAKHEEKKDDQGFISRHFVRRYQLPDDVKPETVTCQLSSDGVLCISAPRMIEDKKENVRSVSIQFTGQPAVTNNKEKCCQNMEQCQKTCPTAKAEKMEIEGEKRTE